MLNKADRLTAEELVHVVAYVETNANRVVGAAGGRTPVHVLPVSARTALALKQRAAAAAGGAAGDQVAVRVESKNDNQRE